MDNQQPRARKRKGTAFKNLASSSHTLQVQVGVNFFRIPCKKKSNYSAFTESTDVMPYI